MKTTLDIPDELVQEIQRLAEHEGKELTDAVTDLLRQALAATAGNGSIAKADRDMLDRRREIVGKFISGEWGVELSGYEAGRASDRESAQERAGRWRT